MKKEYKFLYVDATNWFHEIGETKEGKHVVYDSPEQLKRDSPCWQECGIIKLKVELVEWVESDNMFKKERK